MKKRFIKMMSLAITCFMLCMVMSVCTTSSSKITPFEDPPCHDVSD